MKQDHLILHLERTSRTFAPAIALLPVPLQQEVTIAYLLFRVADTLEDAECWEKERRMTALSEFRRVLSSNNLLLAKQFCDEWLLEDPPCAHNGYLTLLNDLPYLLESFAKLNPLAHITIRRHLMRTISGMRSCLRKMGGESTLELMTMGELRNYCYSVAGIVGEMLTELFFRFTPVPRLLHIRLRRLAAKFGEALQLVNILKDSAQDAEQGRNYLPKAVPREFISLLLHEDLKSAEQYILALREARVHAGIIRFCSVPLQLAHATMERISIHGTEAKLSRDEVSHILQGIMLS